MMYDFVCRLLKLVAVTAMLCVFSVQANSQTINSTPVNLNDWGSGFVATFEHVMEDSTSLQAWRIEVENTGDAIIANAWMNGFSGSVEYYTQADGLFVLTNEDFDLQPAVFEGDTLNFSIQGEGSGFEVSDFNLIFVNLDSGSENDVADDPSMSGNTGFDASFVSVNDWYNPSWGGGFNATYECEVTSGTVTEFIIDFNYGGQGSPTSAWTQSYNGNIQHGFIADDGGYGLSTVDAGYTPALNVGDKVTVVLQVDGAGYDAADFNVLCITPSSSQNPPSDQNQPPLADAGNPQTVPIGTVVSLDGSESTDGDGDALSFDWTLISTPTGSAATLNGTDEINPTLLVDRVGEFEVQLIVSDGLVSSQSSSVVISTFNSAPVANSGLDQSAFVNETVLLDGSGSTDSDGNTLEYFWTLTERPSGSTAVLSDDTNIYPELTVDIDGQYVVELVVSDGYEDSEVDSVIVNVETINTQPVAVAGADQSTIVGSTIVLDGGASSDADGESLQYLWSVLSQPDGSSSAADPVDTQTSTLLIDQAGIYLVQLIVNDGQVDSEPDTLLITTANSKPIGAITGTAEGVVGTTFAVSASDSTDADGDALSYEWSVLTSPDDSEASVLNASSADVSITTDAIGFYVLQLVVSDSELQSDPVTLTITSNPVSALAIDSITPNDGAYSDTASVDLIVQLNQAAEGAIDGVSIETNESNQFVLSLSLVEGENTVSIDASNPVNQTVQSVVTIFVDTIAPLAPDSSLIETTLEDGISVSGGSGSVEPGSSVTITNTSNGFSIVVVADDDGSFQETIDGDAGDVVTIASADAAGNASPIATVSVSLPPPPNPSDIAPPLSDKEVIPFSSMVDFLYQGEQKVQFGMDPGVIEEKRVAVVRGAIFSTDDTPLSGVTVSILNEPQYGYTVSREDGQFDLAMNGGKVHFVEYKKPGYIPVQRQVDVPWADFVIASDVVMTPYSAIANSIDLNSTEDPFQWAEGTTTNDFRGTRQSRLAFPKGTSAEMIMPDGSRQPLEQMTVRITEYTAGENGRMAMPAELPAGTAYTYAVEFSVDEVEAAGGTGVEFSQPVVAYVDNFLQFKAGSQVPVGRYDRTLSAWIPVPNGSVIDVLAIDEGVAILDITGDGAEDDITLLSELGITEEELILIAQRYEAGSSFWRVGITHFSPYDCNWAARNNTPPPPPPKRKIDEKTPDSEQDCADGCIIQPQSRSLGEVLPVEGTEHLLHYQTERVEGALSSLTIPVLDYPAAESIRSVSATIEIAGRKIVRTWKLGNFVGDRFSMLIDDEVELSSVPVEGISTDFTWDGLDAYGRELSSSTAKITISHVHELLYGSASSASGIPAVFGVVSNIEATERNAFCPTVPPAGGSSSGSVICHYPVEVAVTDSYDRNLVSPRTTPIWNINNAGGWSLDKVHFYDQVAEKLYLGNGTERRAEDVGRVLYTKKFGFLSGAVSAVELEDDGSILIGTEEGGVFRYRLDGSVEDIARFSNEDAILALKKAPNGDIYVSRGFNGGMPYIEKIAPDGITSIAIGTNDSDTRIRVSANNDSYPASVSAEFVNLDGPHDIEILPDGTVFSIGVNGIIKITPNGVATNYIGDLWANRPRWNGIDYVEATSVSVDVYDAVYDHLSETLIFTAGGPNGFFLARVDKRGMLQVVAELGPMFDAGIPFFGLDVSKDGEYLVSRGNAIALVDFSGNVRTIAGGGEVVSTGPVSALDASFGLAKLAKFAPNGEIYFIESDFSNNSSNFRRLTRDGELTVPSAPGEILDLIIEEAEQRDFTVASSDGSQLFLFDRTNGLHLETRDAVTGVAVSKFQYNQAGEIIGIEDQFGNTTVVERDASGVASAIISPYGKTSTITLDASGFLQSLEDPNGNLWSMNYSDNGLMTSFTNRRNAQTIFDFDEDGRLLSDVNAIGGGWQLSSSSSADDCDPRYLGSTSDCISQKTTMESAEGDVSVYDTYFNSQKRVYVKNQHSTYTVREHDTLDPMTSVVRNPDGSVVERTSKAGPRLTGSSGLYDVTITQPSGLSTTIASSREVELSDPYDPNSLVSQSDTTSLNGRDYLSVYTTADRTLKLSSPAGRVTTIVNNVAGDPETMTVSGIAPTRYEYDERGRVERILQGSGENERVALIDYHDGGPGSGSLKSITNSLGQTSSYEYNENGWPLSVTKPNGETYSQELDENGNFISISTAGNAPHSFTHNLMDQRVGYVPPEFDEAVPVATASEYDRDERLVSIDRADGKSMTIGYIDGYLNTIDTPTSTYTYVWKTEDIEIGDAIVSGARSGQIESITATNGSSLKFGYDGSLLTSQESIGSFNGVINYAYNSDNNVSEICANDVGCVDYQYDDDQLLVQVGPEQQGLTLVRDPQKNGLVNAITGLNGTVDKTYTYNDFGEITVSLESGPLGTTLANDYIRDKVGRVLENTETVGEITTLHSYRYDDLGRLDKVTVGGVETTWQYDSNGNRTHENGVLVGEYDSQDRLTEYRDVVFEYGANGELARRTHPDGTSREFDYDIFGNLTRVDLESGSTIEYVADPLKRRVGKKVDGVLVQGFLYQDQLNPIAELDGAGNILSRFVYGEKTNIPDYFFRESKTYRIVSDHLGSPRAVIDVGDQTVVQRLDYDVWGRVILDTNPGFQPFGFAGGIYDIDTGLVRFGARDYDAETGRWTAKDPIDFAGRDTNLYAYVFSDPVNKIDPNGMFSPYNVIGAVAGAYFGAQNALGKGGSTGDVLTGALIGAVVNGLNPAGLVKKVGLNVIGNLAEQANTNNGGLGCLNPVEAIAAGLLSILPIDTGDTILHANITAPLVKTLPLAIGSEYVVQQQTGRFAERL